MSARMLSVMSVLLAVSLGNAAFLQRCQAAPAAAGIAWGDDVNRALQSSATSGLPVLIHFYSDNCVPCKMLDARAFKNPDLCGQMNEKIIPVKINVDRHRDLAIRYQITKWPTDLYLHPNGLEIYRTVSPQDPEAYVKLIDRVSTRNRDWITERIATNKSSIQRDSTKPQLAAIEPTQPVTSQSARFQPASQGRIFDETTPTPPSAADANPFCVSASPDTEAESAQGPFHLASHSRENRYQNRSQEIPYETSPMLTPNAARTPANAPTLAQRPTGNEPSMANVSMGGVFHDGASIDLDGYCPVSLMARSEWVLGNPACAVKHRGRIYYCINEEAQQVFLSAPDRFSPVLSGYDVVHFLETGELVAGKREHGCRFGVSPDRERVFLFATPATRERFNREATRYAMSLGQTGDEETSQPCVAGAGNSALSR